MQEYDEFAETYQHWTEAESAYRAIEIYSFFSVLGVVKGLDILDLACGEGRTARMLADAGAKSVLGGDVSHEMVRLAKEQNRHSTALPDLKFIQLDASDANFQLDRAVDVVTAMYLFHYASTLSALQRMCDLISRNLTPGGRFVTYTISPDYDFNVFDPRLMERCGFDYNVVDGNHCTLNIASDKVDIWQWDRDTHEECMRTAGLVEVKWQPLKAPPEATEIQSEMEFYLKNPSCIVLSAVKPA
ncbi:MAG: class I SAM-dependent methyltransferase [Hyphomicrobiales bacterium]